MSRKRAPGPKSRPRERAPRTARGTFDAVPINWKQVDALLGIRCTLREVASVAGVSEDTIERAIKAAHGMTFREYAERRHGPALANLRRRQYELAVNGDRTMLIWLGKQWLGQADKLRTETRDRTLEDLIAAAEDDERGTPE